MRDTRQSTEPNGETPAKQSPPTAKADCYSAGERDWMELGQRLRGRFLGPLLMGLTPLGVTPDAITLIAGGLGAAFLPLWLARWQAAALGCVWGHVLLDGLDGPLARYQQNASPRGSFTDTFTDQFVVSIVMLAWMLHEPTTAKIASGTIYIFLYAVVVAMAMVRNALFVPYSWLVRPRFFVYAAVTLDYLFTLQATVIVLCICNVLLAIKSVSGFIVLRRQLPGPQKPGPQKPGPEEQH